MECASSFLHEMSERKVFEFVDCHTKAQAADIYTKPFVCADSWARALLMIGMHGSIDHWSKFRPCVWSPDFTGEMGEAG